jgi:hypothetical protein
MNPIENLTIPSHAFGSQSDVTVTQAGPGTIVTVPVTVLTETSHGTAPCSRLRRARVPGPVGQLRP